MRNMFTVAVQQTKAPSRKPDLLDILLKLSHTEREAVMKELKAGNKMIDEIDLIYGVKDRKDSNGLLFLA